MEFRYDILIVDDVSENIKVAMNILKEDNYNFSFATNGEQALEVVKNKKFDLILLDIMMPKINGFAVCEALKKDEMTKDIPVIFLSAKADIDSITKGFSLGGVDYITKPFHSAELIARVKNHLELYRAKTLLEQNNIDLNVKMKHNEERLLSELEKGQKEIIYILTEIMESTSDETGKHIRRVALISQYLAYLHPSLDEEDVKNIFHASPMHDIGKITIPREILHKPDRLTEQEFEVMKTHTTNAHQVLSKYKRKIIQAADIIAYQHHEKWDGTGYPRGLKAEEIHPYGRVVAIADVLDALTHKRVYKESWSFEESAKYIIANKGTHFDPFLVELFEQNLQKFRELIEET